MTVPEQAKRRADLAVSVSRRGLASLLKVLVLAVVLVASTPTTSLATATYNYDRVTANAQRAQTTIPRASVRVAAPSPTNAARWAAITRVVGFLAAESESEFVDLTSPAVRRHILDGEIRPNGTYAGGHRAGTGFPSKSEFPASWSDDEVIHEISDVATDPASASHVQGGATFIQGTRDGIDIEVVMRDGEIRTGYPTNVGRNP